MHEKCVFSLLALFVRKGSCHSKHSSPTAAHPSSSGSFASALVCERWRSHWWLPLGRQSNRRRVVWKPAKGEFNSCFIYQKKTNSVIHKKMFQGDCRKSVLSENIRCQGHSLIQDTPDEPLSVILIKKRSSRVVTLTMMSTTCCQAVRPVRYWDATTFKDVMPRRSLSKTCQFYVMSRFVHP